ncbi:MAG: hypothetical protein AAB263_17650 [Planctomycetota bacterium]
MNDTIEHRLRSEARVLPTNSQLALRERIAAALAAEPDRSGSTPRPIMFPHPARGPWLAAAAAIAASVAIVYMSTPSQMVATRGPTMADLAQVPQRVVAMVPEIPAPTPQVMPSFTAADFAVLDPIAPARHEVAAIRADLRAAVGVIRQAVPF